MFESAIPTWHSFMTQQETWRATRPWMRLLPSKSCVVSAGSNPGVVIHNLFALVMQDVNSIDEKFWTEHHKRSGAFLLWNAELPDRCHDLNRLNQRLLVETSPLVRNQRGNCMAIMSVFQTLIPKVVLAGSSVHCCCQDGPDEMISAFRLVILSSSLLATARSTSHAH